MVGGRRQRWQSGRAAAPAQRSVERARFRRGTPGVHRQSEAVHAPGVRASARSLSGGCGPCARLGPRVGSPARGPGAAVCITEYVFGPALDQLALWPEELFLQFGLLAPAGEDGQAAFDARTTVMQLGAVALSVLLERPVTLHDFDHRLDALVEEFVTNASAARTPSLLITPLRTWLRRALQLDAPGYASALEAENGLTQVLAAAGPGARAEIDAAPLPLTTPPRLVARDDAKPASVSDAATLPSVPAPSSADRSVTAPPVPASRAAPAVAPPVTASATTPS